MFVDEARIRVRAGDGGRGCVSFRREAHVPRGGPDGGDGGDGGNIYVVASRSYRTLGDQKYRQHYRAEHGAHGRGKTMHGRRGAELIISVPLGTTIMDGDTGELLADLIDDEQRVLVVRGGRGGRGNARFATATQQTPRIAQPGQKGQERLLQLTLKLLDDIGLVGLPNALRENDPVTLSAMQLVIGTAICVPLVLVLEGAPDYGSMGLDAWGSLVALGLGGTGIAYIVYLWLIEHTGSVRASLVTYIVPVIALFLGWAVLDESLGLNVIAGAALIVFGVATVMRGQGPARVRRFEPAPAAE